MLQATRPLQVGQASLVPPRAIAETRIHVAQNQQSSAELYDPEAMPDDLRAAHDRNDETLERIYIGRRFKNDTERLEKLFAMYTEMTAKQPKAAMKRAKKGA